MKYISNALFIIGFILVCIGLVATILGSIPFIWFTPVGVIVMFLGNLIEELEIWL